MCGDNISGKRRRVNGEGNIAAGISVLLLLLDLLSLLFFLFWEGNALLICPLRLPWHLLLALFFITSCTMTNTTTTADAAGSATTYTAGSITAGYAYNLIDFLLLGSRHHSCPRPRPRLLDLLLRKSSSVVHKVYKRRLTCGRFKSAPVSDWEVYVAVEIFNNGKLKKVQRALYKLTRTADVNFTYELHDNNN